MEMIFLIKILEMTWKMKMWNTKNMVSIFLFHVYKSPLLLCILSSLVCMIRPKSNLKVAVRNMICQRNKYHFVWPEHYGGLGQSPEVKPLAGHQSPVCTHRPAIWLALHYFELLLHFIDFPGGAGWGNMLAHWPGVNLPLNKYSVSQSTE